MADALKDRLPRGAIVDANGAPTQGFVDWIQKFARGGNTAFTDLEAALDTLNNTTLPNLDRELKLLDSFQNKLTGDVSTIAGVGLVNGVPTLGIRGNVLIDGSVVARSIAAGTITGDKIAANTVVANNLYAGELITLSAQIKNGIIGSAHIAEINAATVTISNLNSSNITDGAGWSTTAAWSGVSGTGKPEDYAKKGAVGGDSDSLTIDVNGMIFTSPSSYTAARTIQWKESSVIRAQLAGYATAGLAFAYLGSYGNGTKNAQLQILADDGSHSQALVSLDGLTSAVHVDQSLSVGSSNLGSITAGSLVMNGITLTYSGSYMVLPNSGSAGLWVAPYLAKPGGKLTVAGGYPLGYPYLLQNAVDLSWRLVIVAD